jgi:amino acid transporter
LATETKNIKKAIPTAVRNTLFRILFVYYGLSITYGITVPYNNEQLTSSDRVLRSPMAIALTEAGWVNAKYYVTSMILVICLSSINTAIYLASRALFSWADKGYGPKIFTKTTARGVPYVAIHTCHLFGFLSILSYSSGSTVAYAYIVNVTGVAAFIIWASIGVIHLRFRKLWIASGRTTAELPFKSAFFPYTNYFSISLGIVLVLVQGWSVFKPFDYKNFIDAYILLPAFFICWASYDYYFKTGFVKVENIDFDEDRRPDVDEVEELKIA